MYMLKKTVLVVCVCVAVGSGAYLATLHGQIPAPAQSAADAYTQTVQPVLQKNCYGCHSDRLHTAGLSLEAFRDPALALQHPKSGRR